MLNLRSNGISILIGIAIGAFGFWKLRPIPQAPAQVKVETKTKIVRVTKPSGEVTETTTSDVRSDQRAAKSRYGVALYHDKSLSVDARLGDLPLFFVIGSNLKDEHRIGIRWEF